MFYALSGVEANQAAERGPFQRQYSWALSAAEDTSSSCRVYTFGRNDTGQLGSSTESTDAGPVPNQVLSGRDIVAVSGSTFASAFVTGEKPVLIWNFCHTLATKYIACSIVSACSQHDIPVKPQLVRMLVVVNESL